MLPWLFSEMKDKCSLIYYTLSFVFCTVSCTDVNPVITLQKKDILPLHVRSRNLHYTAADPLFYSQTYSDRVSIFLVQSDTSWLDIKWQFDNSSLDGASDIPIVSQATCDLPNGRIVSDFFNGTRNRFRFSHLMSDTEYTVCVVVTEGTHVETVKRMYSKCTYFRTIPLMRPDSVVGLVLTLGYLIGMSAFGYVAWKCRMYKVTATRTKQEDGLELTSRSNGERLSDIEERVYLNSFQPSSSYKTQEFI
ncbi:uncharacterized protein LOC112557333 [Pomacea canaliculata]|nr:uncharacterized protein LOC112557333 [Pomacea canaliculata]